MMDIKKMQHGAQGFVTYSLKQGIQNFGDEAQKSALKEMKQLHDHQYFQPIWKESLSETERKRALESLIFLVKKRDRTIKSWHCANGSTQWDYMSHEDVSSPTIKHQSNSSNSYHRSWRGSRHHDARDAFVQTYLEQQDKDGNRTIMKIQGVLVDILIEMDPIYKDFTIIEGTQKVLYIHITRAIYGLLVLAILFYKKLVGNLTKYRIILNPRPVSQCN